MLGEISRADRRFLNRSSSPAFDPISSSQQRRLDFWNPDWRLAIDATNHLAHAIGWDADLASIWTVNKKWHRFG